MTTAQAINVGPQRIVGLNGNYDHDAAVSSFSRSRSFGPLANVSQTGCFESDRVIKCGYVQKRTKTKNWKTVFLVLRPNTLSIYKNEKETKLRYQIQLADLTAATLLKDPKHKRDNVFGLFSPSRNYHFQAPTRQDAQEWVTIIRRDAKIDKEEQEMCLASPLARSLSSGGFKTRPIRELGDALGLHDTDGGLSSSPETYGPPEPRFANEARRRKSLTLDSSGMSGTDLPSQSDVSDGEPHKAKDVNAEAGTGNRSGSQVSILNVINSQGHNGHVTGQDPDRVIWQGWLWLLKSKGGVKQWKDMWGVLRPRNLILYKDESEYTAQWIAELPIIVDVVDTDPLSKSKRNCLQIITEEKSYRFCTHDEESLVQFIGALKSLLAKRRGLEARPAPSSS